jgi:hypothetical protein
MDIKTTTEGRPRNHNLGLTLEARGPETINTYHPNHRLRHRNPEGNLNYRIPAVQPNREVRVTWECGSVVCSRQSCLACLPSYGMVVIVVVLVAVRCGCVVMLCSMIQPNELRPA